MTADREGCAQGEWRPGRLWSLWDMLRFHADRFVNLLNLLNTIESLLNNEQFFQVETNAPFVAQRLTDLMEQLTALRMNVSNKKAEQIYLLMINPNPTMAGLAKRYCEDLRERIEHELDGKAIYFVSNRVELLEVSEPLFGSAVDEKFPSARFDIEEAGKCLALGRATASVMHLMRAMELGLGYLAQALNLTLTTENWNTILNDIEKEIRSRTKGTHGDQWKEDEPFFAEAATHFRLVKNAWRNHAAHARVKYTPEEADEIFRSVRSFMRHLAKRLNEPSPVPQNALALIAGGLPDFAQHEPEK
jgi:hypothetical protein